MLGSLFNNIAGLKVSKFLKNNIGVSCRYCKIFTNSSPKKHLWWLLLTVLQWYSEVSWGACSLISRLHMLLILIENFHKTLLK